MSITPTRQEKVELMKNSMAINATAIRTAENICSNDGDVLASAVEVMSDRRVCIVRHSFLGARSSLSRSTAEVVLGEFCK